ncbi:dek protein [Holotrichia oblita]|uniref:Dek protein n=1 Tax=Holotrichia oblita TaxID=644536 RepID=A0ACB9TN27_HOLOL|nr:dek protein [Holotrichia oblita]
MSSDGENTKNISSEGDEKKTPDEKEKAEKMEVDNEVKENEQSDNEEDTNSKQNTEESEAKDNVNSEGSKIQKEVENDTKSEDTSEKEDNENDDKKSVPLLDQPLEISGTREHSDEYGKKLSSVQKFEVKQLKSVCEMLDLEKKGYSSHDDSYSSDEKPSPRGKRDKGKRSNLKDESSSESDEEFRPSDASEDKPRANKRKRRSKKAQSDEEEVSDIEESGGSSEESEDEPKTKKRKVANSKTKPKGTPGRRGRKPAVATVASAKKKTLAKRGRKPARNSSEESEHQEEEGSSSEDEPLVKKPKNPPTDEEIKSYVKDILEGANLEEITMKTVCKQVYAHYPDFDLTHKKDYIKTTVKSVSRLNEIMTEEKHGRASRTTQEQYNILINAVEENPTMKLGKIQITEKKEVDKMWADVTKKLNNCRGPQKTVDQWKRTFIEYKSKIKSKARQNLVECRGTGGGPKMVKPLTDIEERLMGLIGKVTCSGDPSLPK